MNYAFYLFPHFSFAVENSYFRGVLLGCLELFHVPAVYSVTERSILQNYNNMSSSKAGWNTEHVMHIPVMLQLVYYYIISLELWELCHGPF